MKIPFYLWIPLKKSLKLKGKVVLIKPTKEKEA